MCFALTFLLVLPLRLLTNSRFPEAISHFKSDKTDDLSL